MAFVDLSDNVTLTSGIFFYDATIDQRGDLYSAVGESRFIDPYVDNTALSAAGASVLRADFTTRSAGGCGSRRIYRVTDLWVVESRCVVPAFSSGCVSG